MGESVSESVSGSVIHSFRCDAIASPSFPSLFKWHIQNTHKVAIWDVRKDIELEGNCGRRRGVGMRRRNVKPHCANPANPLVHLASRGATLSPPGTTQIFQENISRTCIWDSQDVLVSRIKWRSSGSYGKEQSGPPYFSQQNYTSDGWCFSQFPLFSKIIQSQSCCKLVSI